MACCIHMHQMNAKFGQACFISLTSTAVVIASPVSTFHKSYDAANATVLAVPAQGSSKPCCSPCMWCMYMISTLPDSSHQQLHSDVFAGMRKQVLEMHFRQPDFSLLAGTRLVLTAQKSSRPCCSPCRWCEYMISTLPDSSHQQFQSAMFEGANTEHALKATRLQSASRLPLQSCIIVADDIHMDNCAAVLCHTYSLVSKKCGLLSARTERHNRQSA